MIGRLTGLDPRYPLPDRRPYGAFLPVVFQDPAPKCPVRKGSRRFACPGGRSTTTALGWYRSTTKIPVTASERPECLP